MPSVTPSAIPTVFVATTSDPTQMPSANPSIIVVASETPSVMPSSSPSNTPSVMPSSSPSNTPSVMPSAMPSMELLSLGRGKYSSTVTDLQGNEFRKVRPNLEES